METPHDLDAGDADAVRPLAFPFERDRFRHVLVERQGDVCLVERMNLVVTPPSVHWEVVVLQHRPAERSPRGRWYPARETYPASEDWGTHGWTFTAQDAARAKMAGLCPHVHGAASSATRVDRCPARPVMAPAPAPPREVAPVRRPVGTLADYPAGTLVQLASGDREDAAELLEAAVEVHGERQVEEDRGDRARRARQRGSG